MALQPNLFLVTNEDQAAELLARLEAEPRTAQYRIDSEACALMSDDQTEVTIVGRGEFFGLNG